VAGTALACWLLAGIAPDVRAEATAIGVARSRPSSVVYLAASGTGADPAVTDDLGTFVGWLFAGHLDRVAGTLRARHQLGAQLVWGNVAAACASGVGAVHESAPPDWPDRLADFLAAAPHGLAALGRWSFGAPDEARGPEFRRRTCCLWWKTTVAAGALCADCSLHAREPSPPTPSPSVSPPPRPAGPSAAPTPGSTSPA
jgi:ferric iron reductase protein FhuF